ncbi:VOC family protein [Amycolatopsis sp.]|uniref:VOC family protein n=1 Tax=Amycolatopsis sp. TaxID=37632 RepID=UPI002D7EE9AA|nr:VOC family protein [Amycolatopsis sp.]HET6706937.1 VOC family protein [Amycolatopsis sp.]
MHIDHTVFLTRKYAETWRRYEELGFTLSPPSRHFAAVSDQSEPVPSCTANRCPYFGGSFLEFIGIVDEAAGDPWRVLPILDARGDGLHGCSFGVDDSAAAERRLREAGLSTSGVLHTAEHVTPQYVHQPRYLRHPNGARGVAGILLVVPDGEIKAYEDRYAAITNNKHLVDIVGVSDLDAVLPGESPKEAPYFATHGVLVEDVAKARALAERHVPTVTRGGGFFVPARHAGGAALYFEEAR